MKINAILNEQQIIKEQILNERTYREFYALGMLLQEYAMTQQQIQQLFQQVADGAARGGNVDKAGDAAVSNRTMLGKGADVAGSVAKAYQGVKEYIGKTGPVKGLDAMIDNAQAQIMKAAGGEQGKVSQAIEFYRELSKVPGMAFAVKGIILALAGLAGSGLGPVGIAAGLTFANKMLQGDKFSSAVMSATETGGMVAGIQKAKELLGDTGFDAGQGNDWGDKQTSANGADGPAGSPTINATQNTQADVPPAQVPNAAGASAGGEYDFATHSHDYTVKPGDNLSTILDKNHINPELAKKLNPELFGPNGNPNVLQAGQTIRLPDADALKDMQTMIYTGPGNQIGQYHGQYEPGNPDSLDATNIQKQIDAGRYGSDNGMAAQRIAQDAGTNAGTNTPSPSSNANGAGPSLDNMGQRAGTTPEGNPIYVKQAPPMAPADGTIDPKTGYVKGNPWGKPGTRAITSSYKNPNKLIREHAAMYYIDRETTARRWVLNEQLGRARGSYYLTPQGVAAVFKEVEAQYLNEGPMLDKLKSFNQKASSAIGKFTAPIKQAAAAGWDSATNKITARDLDMNWRRSAKLDKEASVDSAKVVEFLKKQGVKAPLITASFKSLGLQEPGQATATTDTATAGGVASQGGGFLGGLAKGLGVPDVAKDIEAFNASTGGNKTRRSTTTTSAAGLAQSTAAAKPTQDTTATGATTPVATGTTAKLPTATSSTAGQPSKVSYDPKMFAKKAVVPNFNALSTAASQGYKTAQPTVAPTATDTMATSPTDTTTAKTRTGGKVPGQVSQTPNAIRKRAARAGTNSTSTPSAFGNMAAQLAARPTASSTGGTTTGVAGTGNGVVSHTANPNNPNLQPATTTATKKTQKTNPFAGLGQPAGTFKGRQSKTQVAEPVEEPVAESRVDFGAMLFNRMKSGQ